MSKLASSITKASVTTTIHYKQLAPARGLSVVRIQTTCQPLNIPVMVPVGMNSSTGGLIGGSRSACHLTVAGCGCAAPLMAR